MYVINKLAEKCDKSLNLTFDAGCLASEQVNRRVDGLKGKSARLT